VRVRDQFFGGQPAHALDATALDLADVNRPVERRTHVMQDVHAQYLGFTGEGVYGHFGAGRAVGKVIKGPTAERGLVVVDFSGRAVKAVAPELHPLRVGQGGSGWQSCGFAQGLCGTWSSAKRTALAVQPCSSATYCARRSRTGEAARSAARPFRSVPADAAVALALGTLVGVAGADA
jgi:hypothetical protein